LIPRLISRGPIEARRDGLVPVQQHCPPSDIPIVRSTYLVCYDISHDRRLRKVHKTMRGFGDHLQYSVFECQLTRIDLARCRHLLSEIIHHRDDQVLFVDLGPVEGRGDRVISALGRPYSPFDSPCIVVDHDEDMRARPVGTARTIQASERARSKRALLTAATPREEEE
jgi:CRISPR-associated protein Cas2